MAPPTLFVCHGDEGGPRMHPCRRVQEALEAAGIEYEKVIGGHGSPIPFLRKGSREELRAADRRHQAADAEDGRRRGLQGLPRDPRVDLRAAGRGLGRTGRLSRRELIRMSGPEVASFLAEERTLTCATAGPRGWPHLMPLWYVLREAPQGEPGPRLWSWTYASSQKVLNLERDPRASLQVEAGELYHELRGVSLECDVTIHRDTDRVADLGLEIFARYASPRDEPPPAEPPGGDRGDGGRPGAEAGGAGVPRAPPLHLGPPQARRGVLGRRR